MTKILTKEQQNIIYLVKNNQNIRQNFYLTGGTALAEFYFQHRTSDDLDFFSEQPFPLTAIEPIITKIRDKLKANKVKYNKLYDRHIYFFMVGGKEIKVEFTYFENKRINPINLIDGLNVDNLLDIGANKIMAILDRDEPKDFIDLYFIISKIRLKNLLGAVKEKYQIEIDPITLGTAFAKGEKIAFPNKKLFKGNLKNIQTFWSKKALDLKPKIFEL